MARELTFNAKFSGGDRSRFLRQRMNEANGAKTLACSDLKSNQAILLLSELSGAYFLKFNRMEG